MTVAVYVAGKFLVADKRSTGGADGLSDNISKICTINNGIETIYVVTAGMAIMKPFMEILVRKHFVSSESKKKEFVERLYLFKSELSPYVGESWEGLIVFIKKETNCSIDAYRMSDKQVEKVKGFCSIGSGGYQAEGIYLSNPDTPPEDYAKMISKREVTVGPTSDVIKF